MKNKKCAKQKIFGNFFSVFLLLICPNLIQSQNPSYFINDRTYFQQDSIWYVQINETNEIFMVDVNSVTVKLNNPANFSRLELLVNNIGVEIKRENILGYIDIFIPNKKNIYQVWETLKNSGLFESVEINSFGRLLFSLPPPQTPNDPSYGLQNHLNHSTYPDINAPEGWDLCNNFGDGIIIAILDDGFDYDHPDLVDNVWWPTVGYDFIADLPILESQRKRRHATMVAGGVGSMTNNGLGVAGVAGGWFPSQSGSQIMSVVMGSIVQQYTQIVDDAIIYAVLNGAKILNFTWNGEPTSAINAALDWSYNSKGCIIVSSAGNSPNVNFIWYPASNDNVVAIAGIKNDWTHYGNTGYQIELTAPAEKLFTTSYDESAEQPTYASGSGTSGSSPMVSGAAALLWSDYPALTNFDIRRILKETADSDFSTYNELYFGEGILKIDNVLQYAANMPNKPNSVAISAPIGGKPTISWASVPGADYYNVYRSEPNLRMLLNPIANTTNTSYTDYNVTVVNPKFAPFIYYYRVTAVKNGYESPVSSEVSCGSNSIDKIGSSDHTNTLMSVELLNNFPNPFNPSTMIKYRINEDSFVRLKIYDILGRLIKALVSEMQEAGEYSVEFNAEYLSAGIYFYTLSTKYFYQTKKMILLP